MKLRKGNYEYVKNELNNAAKLRLAGLSDSFGKLAGSFHEIMKEKIELDNEDLKQVFEELSSGVCKCCENLDACWDKHFDESYKETNDLLQYGKLKGAVNLSVVTEGFAERCIHLEDYIREMNRGLSIAKMRLSWHNRLAESREAVAGQFGEVARIVDEFSDKLCDTGKVIDVKKRQIYSILRMHRIKATKLVMFERENRGLQLHFRAKCTGGRCVTTKEAAILLSMALDCRLVPREDTRNVIGREYADYVLCEDTNFQAMTGVARASKVRGELSGDNFSFLYPDNGDLIMLLSDGMGSGAAAYRESEMVIELLEQFLEAGFREESAVKMINSALVLRTDQSMFSTMDLCVVNLCTGTCEFVKVGAASTFIKRDGMVEIISSSTLPAGMLSQVDYEMKCKKLYDGDYVIMVSDGVLDCVTEENKEAFFQDIIQNITTETPQEMANGILTAALSMHGYQPVDDMTVLVCSLTKKQ